MADLLVRGASRPLDDEIRGELGGTIDNVVQIENVDPFAPCDGTNDPVDVAALQPVKLPLPQILRQLAMEERIARKEFAQQDAQPEGVHEDHGLAGFWQRDVNALKEQPQLRILQVGG